MSIIQGNAKQGSTRGFYNFPLEQSLRFNDDDTAYLSWTPASAGNRKTWTWSGWVKRSSLDTTDSKMLFDASTADTNASLIEFGKSSEGDTAINVVDYQGSYSIRLRTNAKFRDPSAWYHIVVAVDTTQATASNRVKIYVNGEQQTSLALSTYPSQNHDTLVNATNEHRLGKWHSSTRYFDGYLAEVNFIDGTALDADSFGELKSGVWIPKDPSGLTYGTNGFRLSFADDAEVEAFNTVLYRGNGGTQSVTGMGFQPDLVWIKNRSSAQSHSLSDAVRGFSNILQSNETSAEASGGGVSVISDGFTLETGNVLRNASGNSYVAWGWKAGDSNVSNTDGSITSTVRANDTYGFSIVSYTGNGSTSGETYGHGLNQSPDLIITKARTTNSLNNWPTWHKSLNANSLVYLNLTSAQASETGWMPTLPSDTLVYLGTGSTSRELTNNSGVDYIAYCWAEKAGYSKFGSYSGGTANYKVTTDFRPSLVLVKRTDSTSDWQMFDGTRNVSNPVTARLNPNQNYAELTNGNFDILDDGFELNDTSAGWNASGGTYIYAAFADTREAAFWLDQSGNDNDWQPVNLDHNDTVADSPTDNYVTFNPLHGSHGCTLSDGNLRVVTPDNKSAGTTIAPTSGQWYAEVTVNSANYVSIGVCRDDEVFGTNLNGSSEAWMYSYVGTVYKKSSSDTTPVAFTTGDVISICLDIDNQKLYFLKNGSGITTSEGTHVVGTTGISIDAGYGYYFCTTSNGNNADCTWNFGQQPFKYDPPA